MSGKFVIRLKDERLIGVRKKFFDSISLEEIYHLLGLQDEVAKIKSKGNELSQRRIDESIYGVGLTYFGKMVTDAKIQQRNTLISSQPESMDMDDLRNKFIENLRSEGYDSAADELAKMDNEKLSELMEVKNDEN